MSMDDLKWVELPICQADLQFVESRRFAIEEIVKMFGVPIERLGGLMTSRPMVGFLAGLTPEQRDQALAYRGPENHGNPDFKKRA